MPPAPQPLHLLIADATLPPGTPTPSLPALPPLPNLHALLAGMRVHDTLEVTADDMATPFELALARAHGLPDAPGAPGRIAWAAFDTGTVGTPCAWFRPCHWQVGMDQISLLDPTELQLTDAESRQLLAALQPLLQGSGLALNYALPDRWLATGDLLRGVIAPSMARALQQPLTPSALFAAPDAAQSAQLRRLQNELQMLLHQQPVNDARERARRWSVNALWIEGAGTLDHAVAPNPHVRTDTRLQATPASSADYAQAWQAIDAQTVAPALAAQRAGAAVRLSLCGAHRAITLTSARGPWSKFLRKIRPQRLSDLREKL